MNNTALKNNDNDFIKVKHRGKIFTPDYLAKQILDMGHYVAGNISKKHVIDNSCGDGQFLIQIVDRYCTDFLTRSSDKTQLREELETYIHGIDIENEELEICRERCSKVALLHGISEDIEWDFIHADALLTERYNGKMDFVIGNPPYVRVHNLDDNFERVKSFLFGNGGMTDLYIVFYELGINMLNDTGILCYITPSSFFSSIAGKNMRNYLADNKVLESVCDLKHFQPFNAASYTAIICLNKKIKSEGVKYYKYDEAQLLPVYVEMLSYSDFMINGAFYFEDKKSLALLKKILENKNTTDVAVKNGYATLADKIFANEFEFDSDYIIPVVKASRGSKGKIFFPYDKSGSLISEDELKKDKTMYEYLLENQSKLMKRSIEKNNKAFWYAFGRSQAIKDTYKDKLAINSMIRTFEDLKITEAKSGTGVYGGLYITSKAFGAAELKKALMSEEFSTYVSLLGKYKSGGYYTFSSKDVKCYLDYKLEKRGDLYA